MAEIIKSKTLNTILRLKYDTLAAWKAAEEYVPMKGEVCIVAVPADAKQVASEPAILFKVGDGTGVVFKKEGSDKTELPWASGLAADVHAWAKKSQAAAEDIKVLAAATNTSLNGKTVTEALDSLKSEIAALVGGENGGSIQDLIDASISKLDAEVNRSADNKYIIGIKQVDGVITELVEADLPDYTNTYAAKELETTVSTLRNEFNAHTEAVSGYDARITAAQEKADLGVTNAATAQARADEAWNLANGKTTMAEVEAKGYAVASEIETELGKKVDKVEGYSLVSDDEIARLAEVNNYNDAEVRGLISDNADAIAGVKTTADAAATKVALDEEIARAKKAEEDLAAADVLIQTDITTLVGSDAGKSVRKIANEELAAQLIAEGAAESLDTLQEIAAWIQSHPEDASAMNVAIEALQAKTVLGTYTEGEEEKEYATVKAYVEAAIAALKIGDYALAADLTALAGRVTTNEGAITTINTNIENITKDNGIIDTKIAAEATARNTAISEAVAALDSSVTATAEADNQVSVLTGITQEDGKLTNKTEVKLAAIAKTGNVNDLVQTNGEVLVLFGGNASGWTE